MATTPETGDPAKAAIELAVREFGRLDCLYNNAGGAGMFAPIQDIPVDAFDRTMALLLRAAFIGIKDIVSNFVSRWELIVGIITMIVLFRFNEGLWGFVMHVGRWIAGLGSRRRAALKAGG